MNATAYSTAQSTWPAEFRATIRLAWPLVLTNVAQVALTTTDVILMGWLGPWALAGGALGHNLNFVFMIFVIGLVTATSPMVSIELGRRRHSVRDVRRTVRQGVWAAIAITIPIWVVLWNSEAIFLALNQDPETARHGASFLRTLQWAILPYAIYVVFRNFVASMERPMMALWVAGAAVPFNAVLVWALIFGKLGLPELGLPGAGLGTTITNTLMMVVFGVLLSLDRRFRRYHLFGRFWRPDWQRFREIWRIGLPIAATLTFEVSIFNAAAFLIGMISVDQLAAHTIAIQTASVAFMVPLGIGMAATVRVGLAYGRGDRAGIGMAGWSAFILAVGYACVTAIVFTTAGRPIAGLFLDLGEPAHRHVIALAVSFLALAGVFQLADAGQAAAIGMLRGLGDTRVPMIMAGLGYWGVGLAGGVVLAFPLGLEGAGVWIGLASGLAAVWAMLLWRWIRRERYGLTSNLSAEALESVVPPSRLSPASGGNAPAQ